jgi:predicted DNA binding CopG/RHH family protein
LVLTITYAHFQREGVSQIKKKEGTGIKRVNINIPTELHNSFKASTAAQGLEMTVVLQEFIENYVSKHGNTTPKKKGRRA